MSHEFESDNERRVLGFITEMRDTVELIAAAVGADEHTAIDADDGRPPLQAVGALLQKLQADGLAKEKNGSWSVTKAGREALGGTWPS